MSLAAFNIRLNKLEKKLGESVSDGPAQPVVDHTEELAKLSGKIVDLEGAMQSSSLECKELTNLTKTDVDALSQKIGKLEDLVKKLDKKIEALKKAAQQDNSSQV
jgi:predicted  nucleic acid-binding Zn-ribbon protein